MTLLTLVLDPPGTPSEPQEDEPIPASEPEFPRSTK